MVFTCAVHPNSPIRLDRRTALAAIGGVALAVSVAGCTSHPSLTKPTAQTVASDPLGPLYTETLALITAYDQAIAVDSTLVGLLGPLRQDHLAHATALAALMGIAAPSVSTGPDPSGTPMPTLPSPAPSVSTSPAPRAPVPSLGTDTATSRAQLSEAEKTGQTNAIQGCVSATGSRAAVLASIAACRATHVAVLR